MALMNCKNCDKLLQTKDKRARFCSKSCSASFNNHQSPKRRKRVKNCKHCSNEIISVNYRTVCDICLKSKSHMKWIQNSRNKNECLSVKDIKLLTKNNQRPWTDRIRSLARSWYSAKGKNCSKCGYKNHVEVCHIKNIASFPDSALIKEINCIENILYLCPNHHWELDNL